jgi:hypothetical protein
MPRRERQSPDKLCTPDSIMPWPMWLATFPVAASIDIIFMHQLHTQEKEKLTPRKPPALIPARERK